MQNRSVNNSINEFVDILIKYELLRNSYRYTANVSSVDKREHTDYKILECAIIIQKLEAIDYGTWRCKMYYSDMIPYVTHLYGSIFHVDYPNSGGNTNAKGEVVKRVTRADNVYTKRGDPFTVNLLVDKI